MNEGFIILIISGVYLVALLVVKELMGADNSKRFQGLSKYFYIPIIPIFVLVAILIAFRVIDILT
jgi:hypothetical protein